MTDLVTEFQPYDWEANKTRMVDHVGHFLTLSLFAELRRKDVAIEPLFSLADWRKRYIAIADPTEYATAMHLIGSWPHWLALRNNKIIAKHIDEWQQEVEIKLRSAGVRNMMSLAGSTAPGAAGAAKFLAEGGFVEDKRLRTKEGKAKEETVRNAVKDRTAADAARLGLVKTGSE